MLKCRDIAHLASDYVEGDMALRRRLALALHLLICGHCRAFVRHMRCAIRYFQHLPGQEISPIEAERIAARVREDLE